MNDLKWNEACLVGIPAVDFQHKRIFDSFAAISAAASGRHEHWLADPSFAQLVDLLQQHFALEESMMRSFDYPELERHMEEHRQFHLQLRRAAKSARQTHKGASREMVEAFKHWHGVHVRMSDMHYIEHFAGPARRSAHNMRTAK